MKVQNIKPYRDKETGELQKPGDIREVSAKRGKVLIEKHAAVEVVEPAPPGAKHETSRTDI